MGNDEPVTPVYPNSDYWWGNFLGFARYAES
jgi:hypothetical protein